MNDLKVGKYDLTNEQYHSSLGISRSALVKLFRTESYQLFYQEQILGIKSKSSAAMHFGSAVHSFIMEPEVFNASYYCIPKLDMRKKESKQQMDDFLIAAENKTILTEEDMTRLHGMRDAFFSNDILKKKLPNAEIEKSYYWVDPETGLQCKCRPDFTENLIPWDIKTTSFEDKRDLEIQILDAGIYIQAAMILDGIEAVEGVRPEDFIIVFINKEAPHHVFLKYLDHASIDIGTYIYKNILKNLQPFYTKPALWQMPEEIGIPEWGFDKLRRSKYVGVIS